MTFHFDVPPASSVPTAATLCTRITVGADPFPLTYTLVEQNLFCISRDEGGFTVEP